MTQRKHIMMACLLGCLPVLWAVHLGTAAPAGRNPLFVPRGLRVKARQIARQTIRRHDPAAVQAQTQQLRPCWAPDPRIQLAGAGAADPMSPIHVSLGPAGTQWICRHPAARLTFIRPTKSLDPPSLNEVYYIRWLASLARSGRWERLGSEMEQLGADPRSITEQSPVPNKKAPNVDLAFGGLITPSSTKEALNKQLDRLDFLGFDCPVVLVKNLKGDWRDTFDTTFDAIKGRMNRPIIGLCISKMNVQELLRIPAFLRRYQDRCHSVVVNYDLTNSSIAGDKRPESFRHLADRVSLVLALKRRAAPSAFTWLATGYHQVPSSPQWVKAQDGLGVDGVALTGSSAHLACMYPETAAQVRRQLAKAIGDVPIAMMAFDHEFLGPLLRRNDDYGWQEYQALLAAWKKAGLALVHIQENSR